jgi:hypothetical protein
MLILFAEAILFVKANLTIAVPDLHTTGSLPD